LNFEGKAKHIEFKAERTISDEDLKQLVADFKDGIHHECSFQLTEEQADHLAQMFMSEDQYFLFALNNNLPAVRLKK
jgi:hypothetical protein